MDVAGKVLSAGLGVLAAGAYVVVIGAMDLPEELPWFLGISALLGLMLGRWWALLGSQLTWLILVGDASASEDAGYVFAVYMPLAALSIAVGVAAHRAAAARTCRRAPKGG